MGLELHLYDFDGTLFRSPTPPKGYDKSWWGDSFSLEPPCVPLEPDNYWWIVPNVQSAKQSIANPEVWAILCTGRAATSKMKWRVADLVRQQGLRFDELYLNPGMSTRLYKQKVLEGILKRFPEIEKVQIWEDHIEDLPTFVRFVEKNFNIPCIPHLIKEKHRDPICSPEEAMEARKNRKKSSKVSSIKLIAERWLEASTHRKSLALVEFLSQTTQRLGVAEHVYVVGGAVRNFVIDKPIKDIDIMIDTISSGKSSEWLAQRLARIIPTMTDVSTNQYGVAILTIKGSWSLKGEEMKGEVIEIAEARKESYTDGGYKPTDVQPGTVEEDIYRREFTFNTLMWRLSEVANGVDKAEIIDITGCGLRDLQSGEMKCPSDPDKTFSDDPSRMVRAVKFLIKYGFTITPEVKASIKKNSQLLKNIPSGALSQLLIHTIFADRSTSKKALVALKDLGLLDPIADIIKTDKSFSSTLENWSSNQDVVFMLDLIDMGLPLKARIGFLSSDERKTLRENVVTMTRMEAIEYVGLLRQPSKALQDKRFLPSMAREKGLKGRAVGDFMAKVMITIRKLMLHNPDLSFLPRKLRELVAKVHMQ